MNSINSTAQKKYYCYRGLNLVLKQKQHYFLTASQIVVKLGDRTKLNLNDGTINKLGKALKKHNFVKISKKTGYVYAVKELTYEEEDIKNKEFEKD